MKNEFKKGESVYCISVNFPLAITTEKDKSSIGTQANLHPKINEILVISEVLGDFLRFEKYDTDSFNWWHYSRFTYILPLEEGESFTEEDHYKELLEAQVDAFFCYSCSALEEWDCCCENGLNFDEENIYLSPSID